MTCMRLFVIKKNGDLETLENFGNSFKGAYRIWTILGDKYFDAPNMIGPLSGKRMSYYDSVSICFNDDDRKKLEEFWNIAYRKDVAEHHRITMLHTYIGAMVKKEDFKRLVEAFEKTIPEMDDPGHLVAQVSKIKELQDRKDIMGICWQHDSSNADEWNEGRVDTRPFNIFRDENPSGMKFWLFDELEGKDSKISKVRSFYCSCGIKFDIVHDTMKDFKKGLRYANKIHNDVKKHITVIVNGKSIDHFEDEN